DVSRPIEPPLDTGGGIFVIPPITFLENVIFITFNTCAGASRQRGEGFVLNYKLRAGISIDQSASNDPGLGSTDSDVLGQFTLDTAATVTVAYGANIEIGGAGTQSVTFVGAAGTLKIDNSVAFTGQVSGFTGSDAIDLANVGYGANTTATFSGNANGGTLTVTDGIHTANISLQGNYLSS